MAPEEARDHPEKLRTGAVYHCRGIMEVFHWVHDLYHGQKHPEDFINLVDHTMLPAPRGVVVDRPEPQDSFFGNNILKRGKGVLVSIVTVIAKGRVVDRA